MCVTRHICVGLSVGLTEGEKSTLKVGDLIPQDEIERKYRKLECTALPLSLLPDVPSCDVHPLAIPSAVLE